MDSPLPELRAVYNLHSSRYPWTPPEFGSRVLGRKHVLVPNLPYGILSRAFVVLAIDTCLWGGRRLFGAQLVRVNYLKVLGNRAPLTPGNCGGF